MTTPKSKCCNAVLLKYGTCYNCGRNMLEEPKSTEQAKCECNKYLKISNYVSHCPLHFPSQYDVKTRGAVCGKEQAIVEDWEEELIKLYEDRDITGIALMIDGLIQDAKQEGYKKGCEEQRKKDMALNDSCKKEISRNVMQSSYDFNKGLATAKEKILNQKN